MTQFTDLGLAEPLLKALASQEYTTPTAIQAQAIPHALAGSDVLGLAQTGTGKTAAFALPILHRLAAHAVPTPKRGCRALILSPTRELAAQIAESFRVYGKFMKLTTACVFGGVPLGRQIKALVGGVDILVATPGRLLDLFDQRAIKLDQAEILVLDEADRMLDMGFIHPIKRVVSLIPAKRQTLFFSATMPKEITALAHSLLNEPKKITVTPPASTVERIAQKVLFCDTARKRFVLAALLADPAIDRAIVFTRTKHGADKLVRHLEGAGIESAAIHGNKSQGQRERALSLFRKGTMRVLVATDIASRGIDVDGISHVFNFDLPNVPESYVHRIGRTARAGAEGIAISLCDREERAYLRDIERVTKQQIPVMDPPAGVDMTAPVPREVREPRELPQGGRPQEHRRGGHHGHAGQGKGKPGGGRSHFGGGRGKPSGNAGGGEQRPRRQDGGRPGGQRQAGR